MKNFLGILYKADKQLGKKTHSLVFLSNYFSEMCLGFRSKFEKHFCHLLASTTTINEFEQKIEHTIQHYKGKHNEHCQHGVIR